MRVVRTFVHFYDGIVFDILHVVPTFSMFLCVILGYATTLEVKIGLFLGWCTTFDFFECIRETDTTERRNVSSIFCFTV